MQNTLICNHALASWLVSWVIIFFILTCLYLWRRSCTAAFVSSHTVRHTKILMNTWRQTNLIVHRIIKPKRRLQYMLFPAEDRWTCLFQSSSPVTSWHSLKNLLLWTQFCISESDVWLSPPITVPVKSGPCVQQGNQGGSAELSLFRMAELTYYLCFLKTTPMIYLQGLVGMGILLPNETDLTPFCLLDTWITTPSNGAFVVFVKEVRWMLWFEPATHF